MKVNSTIKKALAIACSLWMSTTPIAASTLPAWANPSKLPIQREESTNENGFIIDFVDPAGIPVAHQRVPSGEQVASDDDFDLPTGYVLKTPGQSYSSPTIAVRVPVLTDDPTLNAIYAAQKNTSSHHAVTVNLWLPDGSLVNSQTFCFYRGMAGAMPRAIYNENFGVNVPAGYVLTSEVPQSIEAPINTRTVLDLYVDYDGTNADGAPAALQVAKTGVTYKAEEIPANSADLLRMPALAGPAELDLAAQMSANSAVMAGGGFSQLYQGQTNTTTITKKTSPNTAASLEPASGDILSALQKSIQAGTKLLF